ncbi:MAG: amidohydrolase [Balneolaceae bacterium]|nr:amidohydrolase [Balneolaceae bacterium]MBO6793560.1 amidohydrolase [Balneolaceae bacterium]
MQKFYSLILICFFSTVSFWACKTNAPERTIITNANVYTLAWPGPDQDGSTNSAAPFQNGQWNPDAEAIVIEGTNIVFVGDEETALSYRNENTTMLDAKGGTVIPGLVDSHAHPYYFGEDLGKIDLSGLADKESIVQHLLDHQEESTAAGDWILGFGYDEGSMASELLPTAQDLSDAFPDRPVFIIGTHGFTSVANYEAMSRAGITAETESPVGGEIVKDQNGQPNGIFLNNAAELIEESLPAKTEEDFRRIALHGMEVMAQSGYTAFHDAGTNREYLEAYQQLEDEGISPVRVYAMLQATDEQLLKDWMQKGPETESGELFTVRAVKAYYDGSLGIRGAKLIDDYSDKPGHRGISGEDYGFNEELVEQMMEAGFQLGIHAIGDAGNRDMLNFYQRVFEANPQAKSNRHRIEHAQVVHPNDFQRFADLELISSMEPPHMAEDMGWAEDRVGSERIKGAYAWRTFREHGVPLTFNSDLTGSDHNFFYGFYAAITRKNKDHQPEGGWYPEQALTPEEALRAYTSWSAYAAFQEDVLGTIEVGKRADLTILNIDVLNVGEQNPNSLWTGKILGTIVDGRLVFDGFNE